ncbi:MvaI/BcnI family restriction endonuclease [Thermoplasma sp. Kam2015]|uniref:MvaI/BcnI family restriction endonuclease n=1 Tax=Thermoplasma sp. Kam2015 TaxID=2094122 RepID=UPI001F2E177C|nr:MvaI/BcnI family restriction endonuclease [Thermoplasma sp. Kam2015]
MIIYTKNELIERLREIKNMGYVDCTRPANDGCVGNTLEDLLGIEENNIPLANSGEWELKAQRASTKSLITLTHFEPSPRSVEFVSKVLLPYYGWPHESIEGEMSFRQTLKATERTDRGFTIIVNYSQRRVEVSFDASKVDMRHSEWLKTVEKRVGLGELDPQPYWGFDDLFHKFGSKMPNCIYARAEVEIGSPIEKGRIDGRISNNERYWYSEIYMCSTLDQDKILRAISDGIIYVDFDARTHHNHGTKFRMEQGYLPMLYKNVFKIE